ncbi:MAG: hypothetical protein ACJAVX_000466 [Pseudoalteromonas rhizosphaerae]|jgi:hypothetical protein|uniref:hypothetical protein n=1 Tax=Pseudoalteromonas TaxID=53246 RepID=UPI0021BD427B|nr:hypothetical protein [Pseudoalteromonas neustonica]
MKDFINKGIATLKSVSDKFTDELNKGYVLAKEKVNGLPIFISLEHCGKVSPISFDEKHYFVIPFELSEYKFALHTMRCLPNGVPEVNNLPKRRIFHFPNEHAEAGLRLYMLNSTNGIMLQQAAERTNTLQSLANDIDALDRKLTYGMLLVGGLAAIANPAIGAAIAAKAVLPSFTGLFNKYGIRASGDKLSQYQLEKAVKEAQNSIIQEFEASNTVQVINPILQELALTLRTTEAEHDPLTSFNLADGSIPELANDTWRELTEAAICHVYKEVYDDSSLHKQAHLDAKDLRWLKLLFDVNEAK